MSVSKKYPAFCKWLAKASSGNPFIGAALMFDDIRNNQSQDSLVWEFLEATGDKTYTDETFLRAAKIALEAA